MNQDLNRRLKGVQAHLKDLSKALSSYTRATSTKEKNQLEQAARHAFSRAQALASKATGEPKELQKFQKQVDSDLSKMILQLKQAGVKAK